MNRTNLVRGGLIRSNFDEVSETPFLTSTYRFDTAEEHAAAFDGDTNHYIYTRFANPTVQMFEDRLRHIDEALFCRATSSGMAAMYSSLACWVRPNDTVVAAKTMFGSCHIILDEILPRMGVNVKLIDGTSLEAWENAIDDFTVAAFFETPTNPTLELIDIQGVKNLLPGNAICIVDNVFASPVGQSPFKHGADVVIYSTTKHIDGGGRCLGGAILSNHELFIEKVIPFANHTGMIMSPFDAWVKLKALETLDLRVNKAVSNAYQLAQMLDQNSDFVIYPGLSSHPQYQLATTQMNNPGTMLNLDFKSKAPAFEFLNNLKVIDIANNVGDQKSLACHPATTTHRRLPDDVRKSMGISDGLVRISVGTEELDDLKNDLKDAYSYRESYRKLPI